MKKAEVITPTLSAKTQHKDNQNFSFIDCVSTFLFTVFCIISCFALLFSVSIVVLLIIEIWKVQQ